jgi:hydrogenase maturation protein HypF
VAEPAAPPGTERRRLRVRGTVQGVGFRPFVYRHAVSLALSGFVRNDAEGVLIEVQGSASAVAHLCRVLVERPPALARVDAVEERAVAWRGGDSGFRIEDSDAARPPGAPVSVDTATCAACLAEVDDPTDRRFRYPFTNCTDCGPRYTIVRAVPYDRATTTMASFAMCAACRGEYEDPADRRFHAQPNACPACGPRLRLTDPDGSHRAEGDAALAQAVSVITSGGTVAVKGVGGYHLAADATDAGAVRDLRRRKARDDKPFAVMVRHVGEASRLCHVDDAARHALSSPRRPVVVAPRRAGGAVVDAVVDAVAPGLPDLGLMLPYSALHHLLVAGCGRSLVMTSGNLSDDPIAHTDDDALRRLGPLVDAVLGHDRPIHVRCDDSVVRSTGGRTQTVRRSRGYAPEPMRLPVPTHRPLLAVGAGLKNTVAVAKGSTVVPSHHIGDLEHLATYTSFLQAVEHLCALHGVAPELVVHDLHPEYLSTKYALDCGLDAVGVQHHHAHIASCLAEHGRSDMVLGVAFDGLGLGTDGTLWGGELLLADLRGFERVGHLAPVGLPGGSAAVREPWRMAVSWVHAALGADAAGAVGRRLDPRADRLLALLEGGGVRVTTSVGRLFDAVAALVGIRSRSTYEGQAAIELEAAATSVGAADTPCYPMEVSASGGVAVLDPRPLIAAVVKDTAAGVSPAVVAAGFHRGLATATAAVAAASAADHGVDTVVLSGGVFQNVRLSTALETALTRRGLRVLVHRRVPPNDGGISVGQAAVAACVSS